MNGRTLTFNQVEKLRKTKRNKRGFLEEIPLNASECGIKMWGIIDFSHSKDYPGMPLKVDYNN